MKRLLTLFIVLFSFQSLAKTAYVDIMKAFENTKQGKAVKSRLEMESKKAQKNFKSLEMKLQKEEADLKKEAGILSKEAMEQKILQFQQKVANFQKSAQSKDTELQKLQNTLMSPILERLRAVIGEAAKKESYQLVQNVGPDVLWVDPSLDLTKKIVKAYNKKYKN